MPDLIGRYTVSGLLGTGGFAVVWLGHDDRLDDQVAIKVLAENWSQRADLRNRFEQEARVLRRTKSHRVVEVYDIGELPDERPYFVMTYADRGSLAEALRGGRMPVATILRHGADIAYGIQDLHDAGVMHRDVKPSNVLFRTGAKGSCDVLIADLGLSRELDRGSRFTVAVGTPGYMAPELADPDLPIDSRADIYGIGATVYFALTDRPPVWDGDVLVPPGRLRPGLPNGVDATVRRALARNPYERWESAAALGDVLRELGGRTAQSPEPEKPSDEPPGLRSAVTVATSGARTGDVLTTQLVRAPKAVAVPASVAGPSGRRRVLRPVLAAGAVIGVIAAAGLVHAFRPDGADGADARPSSASASVSAAPRLAQPTEVVTAATTAIPSPTTTAPVTTAVAAPVVPTEATTRPAVPPPAPTPLPGTLTRCSTEGGRDHFECFLFSRGNTAYALDFRANDYEVLMWTRKSDDDPYAWSQRWQFRRIEAANAYMIYNRHSARCLALDDQGVGAHLHARPCDPASPNQHWRWTDSTSWILRSALGNCIDVPRGEYFNGQPPFGYGCSGDDNQRWLLRAV